MHNVRIATDIFTALPTTMPFINVQVFQFSLHFVIYNWGQLQINDFSGSVAVKKRLASTISKSDKWNRANENGIHELSVGDLKAVRFGQKGGNCAEKYLSAKRRKSGCAWRPATQQCNWKVKLTLDPGSDDHSSIPT